MSGPGNSIADSTANSGGILVDSCFDEGSLAKAAAEHAQEKWERLAAQPTPGYEASLDDYRACDLVGCTGTVTTGTKSCKWA